MTTKKAITQPLYDTPSQMSQKVLELAWLASIYSQPAWCRERMLVGLDSSMFESKDLFELGHDILRCEAADAHEFPEEILLRLTQLSLISKFEIMFDDLQFMPSLYLLYCREIERRSKLS